MKPGNCKFFFSCLLFIFANTFFVLAEDKIESVPLINLEELSPTFEEDKTELEKIEDKNIILYGESLGTAVAIEVAKDKNFSGIILESPFTSMIEMGKVYYPYLPVRLLLKDKFDSQSKIKSVNSPILVMHGKADKIIPFYMGKKIYELANQPKYNYFSEFDGHMMDFNNNLLNTLESFVKSLK